LIFWLPLPPGPGVYVADDGLPALATSVLLERLNLCGALLRDGAEETALWPAGL
jgi:hypothetical protein